MAQQDNYRPLTEREMRVYLCLLRETMDAAQQLTAQLRAIEIIAGMEATGMPVDPHFTMANPPELPLYESARAGLNRGTGDITNP